MFAKASLLLTVVQLCLAVAVASTFTSTSNRLGPVGLRNLVKDRLRPKRAATRATVPLPQYIKLPVNHLDTASETFLNRYWVDDFFYKPGGPVFFYDNGEATADEMVRHLREGATGLLAKEFNGLLILWEHRFYGTSMPSMARDMKFQPGQLAAYFKYHTIEMALEDVAVFAKNFSFARYPDQDLTPGATPWVFIGGSYPGARAAWARSRNPDIFFASLASSAVVQLQEDMWQYFNPVEKMMDGTGYGNCSSDMRTVTSYLNDAFDKQDATAIDSFMLDITGPPGTPLYRFFNFDNTTDEWDNRRTNLRAAIEIMFQDFQYVGMEGYLGVFCDFLQMKARNSKTSPRIRSSPGIFQDFELQSALYTYAFALGSIWSQILTPSDIPSEGVTMDNMFDGINCASRDISDCQQIITEYSWNWQVCYEVGGFQTMNATRPESLLPKFESVDNWIKDCVTYFGKSLSNGPDIEPINKKYGGWNMNPTNVMWNDGEFDPWRALTPHSTEHLSPKRPSTTEIPANGQTAGGNSFFGYVVPGGFHCADLGEPPKNITRLAEDASAGAITAGINTANILFIDALNSWLPGFEKHTVSDVSKLNPADFPTSDSSSKPSGAARNMASFSSVFCSAFVSVIIYSIL